MKERNVNKIYFTWRMLKQKRKKINENRKENMSKNGKSEPRNFKKVEESMQSKCADKNQDVKKRTKKSVMSSRNGMEICTRRMTKEIKLVERKLV